MKCGMSDSDESRSASPSISFIYLMQQVAEQRKAGMMENYDILYKVLLCMMRLGAFRKYTLKDAYSVLSVKFYSHILQPILTRFAYLSQGSMRDRDATKPLL